MADNVIKSNSFKITNDQLGVLVNAVSQKSTVAALSSNHPMQFGDTNLVVFNGAPKAEFVGEGQTKSPTPASYTTVTAVPRKAQVTVRLTNEVEWLDEARAGELADTIINQASASLAEALDYGVLYRLNPLTGTAVSGWENYLNSTTNRVNATASPDADIRNAVKALLKATPNVSVNGLALSRSEAFELGNERDKNGQLLHPEVGFGDVDGAKPFGLNYAVSETINPQGITGTPNVLGVVGDFANGIYWGVQREIPIERIDMGDPDGLGDLKRLNQVAYRAEIVYAWYVFPERFAVIDAAKA